MAQETKAIARHLYTAILRCEDQVSSLRASSILNKADLAEYGDITRDDIIFIVKMMLNRMSAQAVADHCHYARAEDQELSYMLDGLNSMIPAEEEWQKDMAWPENSDPIARDLLRIPKAHLEHDEPAVNNKPPKIPTFSKTPEFNMELVESDDMWDLYDTVIDSIQVN